MSEISFPAFPFDYATAGEITNTVSYGTIAPVPAWAEKQVWAEKQEAPEPKHIVVTSTILISNGHILLAKKKKGRSAGCYQPPGGKLEAYELLINCAVRETEEESGIKILPEDLRMIGGMEHVRFCCHYFAFYFMCCMDFSSRLFNQDPVNKEPDNFENWGWHRIGDVLERARITDKACIIPLSILEQL